MLVVGKDSIKHGLHQHSTAMGKAQKLELMKLHSSCMLSPHELPACHVAVHVAGCDQHMQQHVD